MVAAALIIGCSKECVSPAANGIGSPKTQKSVLEGILKLGIEANKNRLFDCRFWITNSQKSSLKVISPNNEMIANSQGAEICDELKNLGAIFIPMTQYSAFYNTDLHEKLQALNVTEIVLCGGYSDFALLATALDAFYEGYTVHIVQELCFAATGQLGHKKAINDILRMLGSYAKIATSEQALQLLA